MIATTTEQVPSDPRPLEPASGAAGGRSRGTDGRFWTRTGSTTPTRARLRTLIELLEHVSRADLGPRSARRSCDVHIADSLARARGPGAPQRRATSPISARAPVCPGLVLAATLPDAHVVLVESVSRKCAFLRDAAARDGPGERRGRVDARRGVAGRPRRAATCVCARALAALPVLYEYAAPLLRDQGCPGRLEGRRRRPTRPPTAAAAATQLGLREEPARSVTPFARLRAPHAARAAQDRAHAGRLSPAARHRDETPAVCQETCAESASRRASSGPDPPSPPLASAPA